MEKHRAIGSLRSAVDIEDCRVFLIGIIVLRLQHPAVNLKLTGRNTQRLRFCDITIRQHRFVEGSHRMQLICFQIETNQLRQLLPQHRDQPQPFVSHGQRLNGAVQLHDCAPGTIRFQTADFIEGSKRMHHEQSVRAHLRLFSRTVLTITAQRAA